MCAWGRCLGQGVIPSNLWPKGVASRCVRPRKGGGEKSLWTIGPSGRKVATDERICRRLVPARQCSCFESLPHHDRLVV
eukprot:766873-Rhodomonas_salina.2